LINVSGEESANRLVDADFGAIIAHHPNKLGYETLRSQNFEGKTAGDLKEGFFVGRKLPADHKYVREVRIHCGRNAYPQSVPDPSLFEQTVDRYHATMTRLAEDVLSVIARTLNLDPDYFQDFCNEPAAVLRLLHYPPQCPDAGEDERGERHNSLLVLST
jgi:isopenicillin N synthase-like dioxygenase